MKSNLITAENWNMIRDPSIFCFNFDWPIDVDENFKKGHESLAEYKIGN